MLSVWSKGSSLRRADHFIWLLGDPIQKTYEGVLRDLLHTVLTTEIEAPHRERLALMKTVCGSRWTSSNKAGSWSVEELKQILSRLTSCPGTKTFFLIDALDECGSQDNLGDLMDEILWISRLPDVKICVSCRPWHVFTRRLGRTPTLRLDQLTYGDMKIYVFGEVAKHEAELDIASDFRNETPEARKLIRDVVAAAEGVFLWTKLLVKALGREIRKGKTFEQLRCVLADFPPDLDRYFHKMIFERFSSSPRNRSDTAAVLKLALQIEMREQTTRPEDMKDYLARSFINFWLLNNKYLDKDFSWTTHCSKRYSRDDIEKMLRQTAGVLEETCNDLLVLVDRSTDNLGYSSSMEWDVQLVHRKVFDFLLTEENMRIIDARAPANLSSPAFIVDLAKLRCVTLLCDESAACSIMERRFVAASAWCIGQTTSDMPFMTACEELLIAHLAQSCRCFGTSHFRASVTWRLAELQMSKYFLKALPVHPHLVVDISSRRKSLFLDLVSCPPKTDMKGPDMTLLQAMMNLGCDPERDLAMNIAPWQERRLPPTNNAPWQPKPEQWCSHNLFELWLCRIKLEADMHSQAEGGSGGSHVMREAIAQHRRKNCEILELLLQHGADPECAPCVVDHDVEHLGTCRAMPLREIIPLVVPAAQLAQIEAVRVSCMDDVRRRAIRRKQRLKAVQHWVNWEKNLEFQLLHVTPHEQAELHRAYHGLARQFFHALIGYVSRQREHCEGACSRRFARFENKVSLWCVECDYKWLLCDTCNASQQQRSLLRPLCAGQGSSMGKHTFICEIPHVDGWWDAQMDTLKQWQQNSSWD